MCFFATVVVVVAILFIAWLVRFRETGKFVRVGSADVQCGAVLGCPVTNWLCITQSLLFTLSTSLSLLLQILFFPTTLIPHLPLSSIALPLILFSFFPSLLLSLPSPFLSLSRSHCQDLSTRSLCCVLLGWHSTTTELDRVPRPHYSYTVHGPPLAPRCVPLPALRSFSRTALSSIIFQSRLSLSALFSHSYPYFFKLSPVFFPPLTPLSFLPRTSSLASLFLYFCIFFTSTLHLLCLYLTILILQIPPPILTHIFLISLIIPALHRPVLQLFYLYFLFTCKDHPFFPATP